MKKGTWKIVNGKKVSGDAPRFDKDGRFIGRVKPTPTTETVTKAKE